VSESSLRVVVAGYVVRGPLGGLAWHHLQYVLGLTRLGHDAYFVEDSDDYPACYDPVRGETGTDPAYGLRFAEQAFGRLGLGDRWAYHDAHAGRWQGPAAARAESLCSGADLLLNVSGVNPVRPWLARIPARALIDTDPVFTQVRNLTDPDHRDRSRAHTTFFTFGENLGTPLAEAPDDGLPWEPTRQPVVLDAWPPTPAPADAPFTTVMQWDSYPAMEYGGTRYGMKSESFGRYAELPRRAGARFELALGSANAPRKWLEERGWSVCDPLAATRDPWTYQSYIRNSKAEFSVAKQGYVTTRSGWFSERSAAYLASGRPVLLEDTGFSDRLPSGTGLVPFGCPDAAAAGVESICVQYERHCEAARDLAADCFDSRKVLASLVERAMAGA
jgi:hypothetical protein